MSTSFFCSVFLLVTGTVLHSTAQTIKVPDTIKAVTYLEEFITPENAPKKSIKVGIKADDVILYFESDKKEKEIVMSYPESAAVISKGIDVETDGDELEWTYSPETGKRFQLMLVSATDSALNYMLYSGYIHFPEINKWKLIGTIKIPGRWGTIKNAGRFSKGKLKYTSVFESRQAWLQRTNGSWKNLLTNGLPNPVPAPMSNIDSTKQAAREEQIIQQFIKENKTDAVQKHEDVYYKIITQGSGKKVNVTDTVTVHYKGYLLSDGTVFDQTREKPATFPLNRLIKGWQIGVPLLNVGGKIKIVIPSGLAYSIRTRSPKIPPNSILVFEVEVLEAK
jgi:hypothetical protein